MLSGSDKASGIGAVPRRSLPDASCRPLWQRSSARRQGCPPPDAVETTDHEPRAGRDTWHPPVDIVERVPPRPASRVRVPRLCGPWRSHSNRGWPSEGVPDDRRSVFGSVGPSLNRDGRMLDGGCRFRSCCRIKPCIRLIATPARVRWPPRLTTSLIETSLDEPDRHAVAAATDAVRRGEVVAIPSDALYVLVADPFNLNAVAKVFEAKRRETHRSLPLLVDGVLMAEEYATRLSSSFYLLTRKFWPGLLTVIVPASAKVPLRVTGNTGRLALRRSAAPLARELVAAAGTPLIATSANVSGRPTCRSGFEVLGTMDGRIRLILDGGSLDGPVTTTVDITPTQWRLIRRGGVSRAEIAACLAS